MKVRMRKFEDLKMCQFENEKIEMNGRMKE